MKNVLSILFITDVTSLLNSTWSRFPKSLNSVKQKSVLMPEPVPQPSKWVIWKPCGKFQPSASLLTTSITESMSLAPLV